LISVLEPAGEAYRALQTPSWNKGDLLLKESEGKGHRQEKKMRGRGEERRGCEGMRGEEKEKGVPGCIFKFINVC